MTVEEDSHRWVIRRIGTKVAYVVVAWAVGAAYAQFAIPTLVAVGLPRILLDIVDVVLALAQYGIGTRLFRGDVETDAPRAWWRATARSTAAYVIAALQLIPLVGAPALLALLPPGHSLSASDYVSSIGPLLIGVYYLHSAIKLTGIERRMLNPAR